MTSRYIKAPTVYVIQHQREKADFSDAVVDLKSPWVFMTHIEAERAFKNAAGHRRLIKFDLGNKDSAPIELKRV